MYDMCEHGKKMQSMMNRIHLNVEGEGEGIDKHAIGIAEIQHGNQPLETSYI